MQRQISIKIAALVTLLVISLFGFAIKIAYGAPFSVGVGGIGTTTPSGILYGSNSPTIPLKTVNLGSGCTFVAGTLSCSGTFPFTPQSWGNSTSTLLGFLNGFISTASSTFTSTATTTFVGPIVSQGNNLTKSTVTVCSSGCDYKTDGSAADIAINQAITDASVGTNILVKEGSYNISSSINLNKCVNLTINGTITATANINAIVLGDATNEVRYCKLTFYKIIGVGTTTSTLSGILFQNAAFNDVTWSNVTGFNKGIYFDAQSTRGTFENRLYGGLISTMDIGIDFSNSTNIMEGNYIIASIFSSRIGLNFTSGGDSIFTEFHGVSDNVDYGAGYMDVVDQTGNNLITTYFMHDAAVTLPSTDVFLNSRDGNTYLPLRVYANRGGTQGSKIYQGSLTNWRTDGVPFLDFADNYTNADNGSYGARIQMTTDHGMRFFVDGTTTNTQALVLKGTGKVGIGTTTPGSNLSISSGLSVGADYTTTAPTNGAIIEGAVGIGTTNPTASDNTSVLSVNGGNMTFGDTANVGHSIILRRNNVTVGQISTGNNQLQFGGGVLTNTSVAAFKTGPFFGLGTTSPYAEFSIAGNTALGTSPLFVVATSSDTGTSTALTVDSTGNLSFSNGAGITNGLSVSGLLSALSGLTVTGTLTTNGITPDADATRDIGSSVNRYNSVFAKNINSGANSLNLISNSLNIIFDPNNKEAGRFDTSGRFGVGSTSPYARLSIQAKDGDTVTTLFAIGSSTPTATTTLFSIDNIGNIATQLTSGCIQSSSGLLTSTGSNCTTLLAFSATYPAQYNSGTGVFSLAFGTTTANSWSQAQAFSGGLTSYASTTIGNGSTVGGLTINGTATTSTLLPAADSTINLGSSADRYSNVFTKAVNSGANSLGLTSASANIAMNPNNKQSAIFDTSNRFGLSTTSPFAKLSLHANPNDPTILTTLFAVGSSTANATTTLFQVNNDGTVYAANTTSSGANQTGYWCYDANGQFIRDTTTCLVSALKFKKDVKPLNIGLKELMQVQPVSYFYKDPQFGKGEQIGVIADQVEKIDSRLVTYDSNGDIHGFNYEQYTAWLTKAIQDQQHEIESLKVGAVQATRSVEENWQWVAIALLVVWNIALTLRKRK